MSAQVRRAARVIRFRSTRDEMTPLRRLKPDTPAGELSRWTFYVLRPAAGPVVVSSLRSRELTTPIDWPDGPMNVIRRAGADLIEDIEARDVADGVVAGVATCGSARINFTLELQSGEMSLVEQGDPVRVRLGRDAVCRVLVVVAVPGEPPVVIQDETRTNAGRTTLAALAAQTLSVASGLPDLPSLLRRPVLPAERKPDEAQLRPAASLDLEGAAEPVEAYLREVFGDGAAVSAELTRVFEEAMREWPRTPGDLAELVAVARDRAWLPDAGRLRSPSSRGLLALELAADARILKSGTPASATVVAAAARLAIEVNSNAAFGVVLPRVLTLTAEWLMGRDRRSSSFSAQLAGQVAAVDEEAAAQLLQVGPWLGLHCQRSPYWPRLALTAHETFEALVTGRALFVLQSRGTGLRPPMLRPAGGPLQRARHWYEVTDDEDFWPGTEEDFAAVLRALDQDGQHAVLLLENQPSGMAQLALKEAKARLGQRVETDRVAVVFDALRTSKQVAFVNLDQSGYASCLVGDESFVLSPYIPDLGWLGDFWVQHASARERNVEVAGRAVADVPTVPPRGTGPDLRLPQLDEQTFAGRKAELAEIAEVFKHKGGHAPSVLITGPRRAGKTTLAYRSVARLLETGGADHLVMLDLGSDVNLSDPSTVNEQASRMLLRRLRRAGFAAPGAETLTDLADVLVEIDEQAQDDNVRVAILLDEFDVLFASPYAPRALREVARRVTARSWTGVALVLTVQRFSAKAAEVKQAHNVECLPNLGWEACLKYFAGIDELVPGPQVAGRLIFPHGLLREHVEPRLGLRPYWWASLRELIEAATSQDDRRFATLEDFERAYEHLLDDWFLNLLLRTSGEEPTLNDRLNDTYSTGEKRLLLAIAEPGRTHLTTAQAKAISDDGLKELLNRRILAFTHNGKSVMLSEPIYRDFVNLHRAELTAQATPIAADVREQVPASASGETSP